MSTEITSLNGYPLKDETARKFAEEIVVPTKLSELSEDASHRLTTDDEKAAWNAKSNFSGSYNDLTGKPTIPTVPEKVSAFENDAGYLKEIPSEYVTETELDAKGYLTEHQDISHKLDATALPAAVEDALAQAKASGEFDGEDGVGIASIKQTTTSSADGGSNIFTVTLDSGVSAAFTVKNGSRGSAGVDGKDGYTPVKGTDYFTEADKSEMVTLVNAELASETWTFTLSDGSTVTRKVVLG